jgi:hypothetical protein
MPSIFGEERIGLTCCMASYIHIASRSEPWKAKKNLKIDYNSKSYLENPTNFTASWFVHPISKLWFSTLFRKPMDFPMNVIVWVSLDLVSIWPESHHRLLHLAKSRISSSHRQVSTIITPDSFIGLRHMSKHPKGEKVLHDLLIRLSVPFLLRQYHICIFWLLGAIKSDLMLVQKIFCLMSFLLIWRWPPSMTYQQLHAFYVDCYS